MKTYAYKILADGKIHVLHCKSDPESIMKQVSPDSVSGAGTDIDPFVYTPTAEFIGELPKDANGDYIYPDKQFRDQWSHDGASGIEIKLADAKTAKMDMIRADRNVILEKTDAKWQEEFTKASGDINAVPVANINADKTALRDLPTTEQANLDACVDIDAVMAFDPVSSLTLNNAY